MIILGQTGDTVQMKIIIINNKIYIHACTRTFNSDKMPCFAVNIFSENKKRKKYSSCVPVNCLVHANHTS